MKIWILALVVCSGVEQMCQPIGELPAEYKSYYMCTKDAYGKSFEHLFDGTIPREIIEEKRLFTKWSCIPAIKYEKKPDQLGSPI